MTTADEYGCEYLNEVSCFITIANIFEVCVGEAVGGGGWGCVLQ